MTNFSKPSPFDQKKIRVQTSQANSGRPNFVTECLRYVFTAESPLD